MASSALVLKSSDAGMASAPSKGSLIADATRTPHHWTEANLEETTNSMTSHTPPAQGVEDLLDLNRPPLPRQWLVTSPYEGPQHLLDLSYLDNHSRLLALALTSLETTRKDYATSLYEDAFNFTSILQKLRSLAQSQNITWKQQEFYVVDFRSKLKQEIDVDLLFKLDKESHAEAMQSGGLLRYWYGEPDGQRRNLATCVWRNKEDAIKGGLGPWHKQARAVITKMYEMIQVKGLTLTISDGAENFTIEPYRA